MKSAGRKARPAGLTRRYPSVDRMPVFSGLLALINNKRMSHTGVTTVGIFVCMCLALSVMVMIYNHEGYFQAYFNRRILSLKDRDLSRRQPRQSEDSDDLDPELEEDVPAAYSAFAFAPSQLETPGMDWWERQVSRKEHILRTCERVLGNFEGNAGRNGTTGSSPGLMKDMALDSDADILFCPNMLDPGQKATNWETLLAHASSETLRVSYTREVRGIEEVRTRGHVEQKPDPPATKNQDTTWLKRFTKILFVEHPFEKVIALHKNRIQNRRGNLGYEMGKKTLVYSRGYRNLTEYDMQNGLVSFPEMMSFIVHRDYLDPHVKSVYEVCSPCNFDYDYVIKAETFSEDIKHIFKQLFPGNKWKKMLKKFPSFIEEEPERVKKALLRYYSTVREDELLMLYDLYSIDMFMFNYEWPFEKLRVNRLRSQ